MEHPSQARVGRSARRAGALLLAGIAGCASPTAVSYRETAQTSETGSSQATTHSRLLELGVEQGLGSDLSVRGSERLLQSDARLEGPSGDSSDSRLLNQPSVDVLYQAGAMTWNQGFDYSESHSTPSGAEDTTLISTNILEKFEWEPWGLPRVTGWVRQRAEQDDRFIDQRSRQAVLEIEDSDNAVSYLYSAETERILDDSTGVERNRFDQLARVGYRDQTEDGRLSGDLNVSVNDRHSVTDLPQADDIAVPGAQVFPLRAYAQIDSTPSVGALPELPALIDNDLLTPTGIDIGGFASGGEPFWNIAVELPPGETIDLMLLSTLEEVEPLFLSQFSFSVWSSDDNSLWTLVSGSAVISYERAFRRFRIPIPSVSARFVKLVNSSTPPASGPVLVSELRVFEGSLSSADGVSRAKSDDRTTNVSGTLSWRLSDSLTFGYDVFAQKAEREDDGERVRSEERLDNGVRLAWAASDRVDVNVSAREQRLDDIIRQDELFRLLNGIVDYRPLDTLDFALNYSHTDRKIDGLDSLETEAVQGRSSARLLDTLVVDLTIEQNQQIDASNERTIDREIVTATANAELTPSWSTTLGVRQESASVSGVGASGIPDPSEDSHELIVLYRPSDLLTAEVDLEWRDTYVGSGLDQRLRLDWLPFPDGVVDLQLDLQRRVTGALDRRVDQYQLLARWTFSPQLFFETGYSIQKPSDGDSTHLLNFALSARF